VPLDGLGRTFVSDLLAALAQLGDERLHAGSIRGVLVGRAVGPGVEDGH
jgi:hypothetical protein